MLVGAAPMYVTPFPTFWPKNWSVFVLYEKIEEKKLSNLVIFDLDGVITSEEAYWDTAGLVLHELLYSPRYWNIDNTAEPYHPAVTVEESYRVSRAILPEAVVVGFKASSLKFNWGYGYSVVCLF